MINCCEEDRTARRDTQMPPCSSSLKQFHQQFQKMTKSELSFRMMNIIQKLFSHILQGIMLLCRVACGQEIILVLGRDGWSMRVWMLTRLEWSEFSTFHVSIIFNKLTSCRNNHFVVPGSYIYLLNRMYTLQLTSNQLLSSSLNHFICIMNLLIKL